MRERERANERTPTRVSGGIRRTAGGELEASPSIIRARLLSRKDSDRSGTRASPFRFGGRRRRSGESARHP